MYFNMITEEVMQSIMGNTSWNGIFPDYEKLPN